MVARIVLLDKGRGDAKTGLNSSRWRQTCPGEIAEAVWRKL